MKVNASPQVTAFVANSDRAEEFGLKGGLAAWIAKRKAAGKPLPKLPNAK